MTFSVFFKNLRTGLFVKIYLFTLVIFFQHLSAQNKIGICFPAPAGASSATTGVVSFTVPNPISGATQYSWNVGPSSPTTAATANGVVDVSGGTTITLSNTYTLTPASNTFTETDITYTLTVTAGTGKGTTAIVAVKLIPTPSITPIPLGTTLEVCANKPFNLPLSISNKIGSTYGFTWIATSPGTSNATPVNERNNTLILTSSGNATYTISATIDTINAGSPYKNHYFPDFSKCITTTNPYRVTVRTAPQKPSITGTKTKTICVSSTNDKINFAMTSVSNSGLGLTVGWYQLSGKTTLTFATPNALTTDVSGFEGADKNKGPLPEEYKIVAYETNGKCDTLRDTISISVWKQPIANIKTPDPIYFCSADKGTSIITINATSPNGTGTWIPQGTNLPTLVSGTLSDSTIRIQNNTVLTTATETYRYIWEVDNSHCSASTPLLRDTISVIAIHSASTANVVASSIKICEGTSSIDLLARKPVFGTGSWSFFKTLAGTGTPTFSNSGDTTIKVTIPAVTKDSNVYIFKWKVVSGTCLDSSIAYDTVYVYGNDVANITSPDTTWVCSNALSSVTLNATALKSATGTWSLVSKSAGVANPTMSSTTGTSTVISGLVAPGSSKPDTNMYVFAWSIKGTNITTCGITKTSDTVRIGVVNPPSSAQITSTTDTMYVCSTTNANITITATAPTIGQGTWTWTPLVAGTGSITIPNPHDPKLNATATVSSTASATIGYKLTWTVRNGNACASNAKSIIVYVVNESAGTNRKKIQEECALKSPQTIFLQTEIRNPIWNQLPPPSSDALVAGFPNTNQLFSISVTPPSGSAVGHYLFVVSSSTSRCANRDTIELLVNNPATLPSFTAGSIYGDTNYVCHVTGKPDTLYGLSMRNDPATTIGKGVWTQTNDKGLPNLHLFNVLTTKPDTMGAISLVFTDSNVSTTGLATYTLKWSVISGACDTPFKNVVFVVANNVVTGVAEIKNKGGADGIRWLCGNGSTRDTTLQITGGYKGKGVWTQITKAPYYTTSILPERDGGDTTLFRLKGLPLLNNTRDTIKLAYVWNITLEGSKCIQTSADTIIMYIVSAPPDIPAIPDILQCGNTGTTTSALITAPTPAFGQGFWSATGVTITPQPNFSAIVDNLPTPSNTVVTWNLKNAGCPITKTQNANIIVSNGAKAQVVDRIKYICNDAYSLTINSNNITKAQVTFNVSASPISTGTGTWTIAPSSDGTLTIPAGTEKNTNITPTLTIQNTTLTKDSTIYKLYWTTNSTTCGITRDSVIIIAYAPLSDSITNGYNTCLIGSAGANLSTTLSGPYISGKPGQWAQDITKQIIGNVKLNYNTAILSNFTANNSVQVSNLTVPKNDSVNAYAIKRIVPATFGCPERFKTDTIRVYQQASTAQVTNRDTIYLCTSGITSIDTVLKAIKPIIGKGFWTLVSRTNTSKPLNTSLTSDSTLKVTVQEDDSCVYRFRWSTFIKTTCKDTNISSTKDVYVITSKTPDPVTITHVGSSAKADTNWLCQTTTTQLTNSAYITGKATWRVISGPSATSVTFTPVAGSTTTKVNVAGLSLPSSTKNDTSKYLIEFSIINGACGATRDTVRIFILRNASQAQLSAIPTNPEYFCNTVPIVTSHPDDSTVIKPVIGTGSWTKKDSLPGVGASLGIDTIKWTWTVSNRCKTSSVQRVYIIANNPQGDAIIRNKPFTPSKDTLEICLPVDKDTTIRLNGNKPLSAVGTGQWDNFLNGPLTFSPSTKDSIVRVSGFAGTDSVRVYGLSWSISKTTFCPPSYDTAYVKVFRRPAKPIFSPDSVVYCIEPKVAGRDTLVFNVTPSNASKYTFGKFEWTVVTGGTVSATNPYAYIISPTHRQKTARVVLKNMNNLTDKFIYILRLKVSGGGSCGEDSTDYKVIIYPAIRNKNAFGFDKDPDVLPLLGADSSKIVKYCGPPPDSIILANRTLKPYQQGTWEIIANNGGADGRGAYFKRTRTTIDKNNRTSITNMGVDGGTSAVYVTTFTITNRTTAKTVGCSLKDTVTIYMVPGSKTEPGVLEKSDSVCYGTTDKILTLKNPSGVIKFNWQIADPGLNNWQDFNPANPALWYNLPEVIDEKDYRVQVFYNLPAGIGAPIIVGTCPTLTDDSAVSNVVTIRLKNKNNHKLGAINPGLQELCAESQISLSVTYKNNPSELNGLTVKRWQSYATPAYGTGAVLPAGNPWTTETPTTFEFTKTAPSTAQTIFYRVWLNNVDPAGCPFVTDTASVFVKPKPKMSGSPFALCADGNFNFKFDSTTEGGYENTTLYPAPFSSAIERITWRLSNTSGESRTGMTPQNGIFTSFSQTINYKGINNDTIPLIDTVTAVASGVMGCQSDLKTIIFKVYPKTRAELINASPLVTCPPIEVSKFLKLRDYATTNLGYFWNVKDYVAGTTWTSNGLTPPSVTTSYAQNLAIQLTASSRYIDESTGVPCPATVLQDTIFSFGKITPNVTISDSVCFGAPISITNTSSVNTMPSLNDHLEYKWWDKNNNLISTDLVPAAPFIPSNIYPYKDSIYTIKYEVRNKCYSVLDSQEVKIQSIPKADLKVNIDSFCSGTTINIWKENELGNNPNNYKNEWIFGDGSTPFSTTTYRFVVDSLHPIKHRYDNISYTVHTLTQIISNSCGQDTQTHLIKILPVPKPSTNLNITDTICGGFNEYAILNKTFFGGKEPVSVSWSVNDSLVRQTDNIYAVHDTLSTDTLLHSFGEYVDKTFPDIVKPISIKLSVTPTLGCQADTTEYILVGSTAQPEIFIDTIQPCPPANFRIIATAAAGINSWTWSVNDNPIAATTSSFPIQFNSGTQNIKVVVQSRKSICPIDSALTTMVIYGYPVSQFNLLNPSPYCYTPFPAHYQSTAIGADEKMVPITHWYWRIDSLSASASYPQIVEKNDFIYTYPLGGEYVTKHWVNDTRGSFSCVSDTTTNQYTILGRSTSTFTVEDTTCATYSITLKNSSDGFLGFGSSLIDSSYWIMGDGSEMKKFAGAENFNYTYPQGGAYNISLLTKGNNGVCIFDTLTKTIIVRGFPKSNFELLSPCSGNLSTFNSLSTPGFADQILGYKWSFSDGQISNSKNPEKLYDIPGKYTATLTTNSLLCPLSSDTTIDFVITPAVVPMVFPTIYVVENIPFELTAPSDNNSYIWLDKNKDFMNPSNPNAQVVTSSLPGLGTDTFYLRYTNNNCIVDNIQVVQALSKLDVVAPSGFTPNNDGKNDVFIPKYIGIKKLNYFQIFDRFGQLLFTTSDRNQSWDGTFRGVLLPTATYIWVVSAINDKNQPVRASGGITLIKE